MLLANHCNIYKVQKYSYPITIENNCMLWVCTYCFLNILTDQMDIVWWLLSSSVSNHLSITRLVQYNISVIIIISASSYHVSHCHNYAISCVIGTVRNVPSIVTLPQCDVLCMDAVTEPTIWSPSTGRCSLYLSATL